MTKTTTITAATTTAVTITILKSFSQFLQSQKINYEQQHWTGFLFSIYDYSSLERKEKLFQWNLNEKNNLYLTQRTSSQNNGMKEWKKCRRKMERKNAISRNRKNLEFDVHYLNKSVKGQLKFKKFQTSWIPLT